ncbi:MAG TPA: type II toxin-antitoxin system VapC family toxin [Gemmatimonadaceae bacterium]|nr:type II toxin-antitoxin system VapC family toxin [Gemmatimonadaceae bacterium]
MIFVDSNIPMYLIGAPHANKDAARAALERCITRGERIVTSAEVLQEILHRYHAIRRLDAIQPAFDALLGVVDEVYPVELVDVKEARDIMMGLAKKGLSARDALHAAVMRRRKVDRVMSFAAGFDALGWVERVS